jgi:ComF family protein
MRLSITSQISENFKDFAQSLWNFLYPPICHICQANLQNSEHLICEICWNKIKSDTGNFDFYDSRHKREDYFFKEARFTSDFNEHIRKIMHLLKYKDFRTIAFKLGEILAELVNNDKNYKSADFIIPVPLHSVKFRERGYNQAELIAKGLSKKTNIPYYTDIIKRRINTVSQTQFDIEGRKKNVKSAFQITKPENVKGKIAIILDDVITTGSTINEIAGELINAGTKEVLALAFAHPKY